MNYSGICTGITFTSPGAEIVLKPIESGNWTKPCSFTKESMNYGHRFCLRLDIIKPANHFVETIAILPGRTTGTAAAPRPIQVNCRRLFKLWIPLGFQKKEKEK